MKAERDGQRPRKGGFAKLVPEFHLNNLEASLVFWRYGFSIAYRGGEEGFIVRELHGSRSVPHLDTILLEDKNCEGWLCSIRTRRSAYLLDFQPGVANN